MHHNCCRIRSAPHSVRWLSWGTIASDWKCIPAKGHAMAPHRHTSTLSLAMCTGLVRSIGSVTIALTLLSFSSSFSGPGFWLSGRGEPFCAIASNAGRPVSAVPLDLSHSRRIGPAVRQDDPLKTGKHWTQFDWKLITNYLAYDVRSWHRWAAAASSAVYSTCRCW